MKKVVKKKVKSRKSVTDPVQRAPRKRWAEKVQIRIPTQVAVRLSRAAELVELPQEMLVLSLLGISLALAEPPPDDEDYI